MNCWVKFAKKLRNAKIKKCKDKEMQNGTELKDIGPEGNADSKAKPALTWGKGEASWLMTGSPEVAIVGTLLWLELEEIGIKIFRM
jgi:hypothetical protein